jgi:hypothetical protein
LDYPNEEWQHKGATLSDKTARQEFGLTQDEIHDAINAGTLQYRQAAMHGNPWLRLLRREVEALARTRHGDRHVSEQQARAELKHVKPRDPAPAGRTGRARGAASQARLRPRNLNGLAPPCVPPTSGRRPGPFGKFFESFRLKEQAQL